MNQSLDFLFFPHPLSVAPFASTSASDSEEVICYLYGWIDDQTAVVAGGIEDISVKNVESRLSSLAGSIPYAMLHRLAIIGVCGKLDTKGKAKASEGQITISLSFNGIPSIDGSPTTIITFTPPSPSQLQFLSLDPLQLDLASFSTPLTDSVQIKRDDSRASEHSRLSRNVKTAISLDFTASSKSSIHKINLQNVIDKINLSPHLATLFSPQPLSTKFILIPISLSSYTLSIPKPFQMLSLLLSSALAFSSWKMPFLDGTAPKDLSATVQQIDTRLSQAVSWPSQYSLIRKTLNNSGNSIGSANLAIGRAHYIHFYNTMWLIANDIIVGSAVASFCCENSEYLGTCLGSLTQICTLNSLRDILLWLNDWPGGVKLNFELASVFCDAFLRGTDLWEEYVFKPILPWLPTAIYVLGLSGLLGTTMFLSLASDLLSLLTFHIYLFYLIATAVFSWHLSMLSALFNIFRGKKFNLLRNRIEPAVYEVDQLLLGTILFTLAIFLFPTVLAYYLTFASTRLVIIVLHAGMETVLAFMNHFPLFAVMLRFKDPLRLPGEILARCSTRRANVFGEGGLRFEFISPHLKMTNNPLHLAGIFFAHLQLSRRLASHYSPVYLLGRLLTGQTISPIPRVRLTLDQDHEFPVIAINGRKEE